MYVGYAKSVLPKQKLKSVGFQKEKWSIVLLSIFAFYFSGTSAVSNSSFVVINQVGSFIKKMWKLKIFLLGILTMVIIRGVDLGKNFKQTSL